MQPATGDAEFRVFLRGVEIGTAEASVTRTTGGWSIQGTGQLGAPLGVTVRLVEVNYTDDWLPRNATLAMTAGGQRVTVHGAFGSQSVDRVDIIRGGGRQAVFVTPSVSADALVLPNLAYGAYEALAARLSTASPGTTFRAYILPQREISIRLERVTDEAVQTSERTINLRRWRVIFVDPAGEVPADLWVDGGRLARLRLPDQALSVVRHDLVAE